MVVLVKQTRNSRKDIFRKDEPTFSKDKPIFPKDKPAFPKAKPTFGSFQESPIKTSTMACKTCNGTKKIKCNFCHGFGNIHTTRVSPTTTTHVPKVRTVFDSQGRATYQHYTETQVRPGKTKHINQSCGRCMGSGKVRCPNC